MMGIVRYDNNLLRWDPFREMERIQSEINRAFENVNPAPTPTAQRAWSPAVDVLETQDTVVFQVELPGMKQDNIDIELTGDTLTIRGERHFASDQPRESFVRVERSYGPFQRSFALTTPIDHDKVVAAYRDGLLEITLPKSGNTKPRKITVTQDA